MAVTKSMTDRRKEQRKKEILSKIDHAYTDTFQDYEVTESVDILRDVLREIVHDIYK